VERANVEIDESRERKRGVVEERVGMCSPFPSPHPTTPPKFAESEGPPAERAHAQSD
jgi:hypothetical protein